MGLLFLKLVSKMIDVDELRNKKNRTREEDALLIETLFEKRSRTHIRDRVSHKVLDTSNLEGRCQLIVDGLGDVVAEKIEEDYQFNFDAVGLYLAKEKGIELTAYSGEFGNTLRKTIAFDDPITKIRDKTKFVDENRRYSDLVIPLIANNAYQGAILINNEKSKKIIPLDELSDFFAIYEDMAAGAVFGGVEHKRLLDEIKKTKLLIQSYQEFAAGVAHSLNNGFGATGGAASLILEALEQPELNRDLLKRYSQMILTKSNAMSPLAKSLPALARTHSNHKPTIEIYQLQDKIEEVAGGLVSRLKEKNMEFLFKFDSSAREINTDYELMNLVLEEVMLNDVKYGELGSKIEVTTKRDNGIYLSFLNEGFISELERIFEPFYTTSGGRDGTGLGLSVVKGNVKLLGGEVKAENIIEDKPKVRFTIYLPQ